MQYVAIGCRLLIAVVFIASASTKLVGPTAFGAFARSVRTMRVLPAAWSRPVAYLVVAAEVLSALLVLVPLALPAVAGFVVAAGLLAAFAVGITINVRRGDRTPCRCFGKSTTPLGPLHIFRNIFLICAAALGATASVLPGGVDWGGAAVGAIAGIVLAALVVALDDIADLFRSPAASQPSRP